MFLSKKSLILLLLGALILSEIKAFHFLLLCTFALPYLPRKMLTQCSYNKNRVISIMQWETILKHKAIFKIIVSNFKDYCHSTHSLIKVEDTIWEKVALTSLSNNSLFSTLTSCAYHLLGGFEMFWLPRRESGESVGNTWNWSGKNPKKVGIKV